MNKFIEVLNAPIKKKILLNTEYIFSVEEYRGAKLKGIANAVIKMSYNESDIDDKSQQLIYTDETYQQIKALLKP